MEFISFFKSTFCLFSISIASIYNLSCTRMEKRSIYNHEPEEFFDGQYLQAARYIRLGQQSALLAILAGESQALKPIDPNYVGREGMTLLFWSAGHDNIKSVEALLDNGADPNQVVTKLNGDKIQLLAIAAKSKSDALFNLLLSRGANPDSKDRDEPAIFNAIYADRFDRMHQLLDAGADVNIVDSVNTSAIVLLARLRNYKYILELLARGAVISPSAARELVFFIEKTPLSPEVSNYESQLKVKQILIDKGYIFSESKH